MRRSHDTYRLTGQQSVGTAKYIFYQQRWKSKTWQLSKVAGPFWSKYTSVPGGIRHTNLIIKNWTDPIYSICPMPIESIPLYLLRKCISKGQVPAILLPRLNLYWTAFNPQNIPCGTLGKSVASLSLSYLLWDRITLLILKSDWIKWYNAYKKNSCYSNISWLGICHLNRMIMIFDNTDERKQNKIDFE